MSEVNPLADPDKIILQISSENSQLRRLVEKQRASYSQISKELERVRSERDGLEARLTSLNANQGETLEKREADSGQSKPKEESPFGTVGFVTSLQTSETQKQKYTAVPPPTPSLLRLLRDPEPEVERQINEMDDRLENQVLPDRERRRLFNELCKTCGRCRVIPRSMYIPDCSKGSVEVESGGSADVLQGTHKGFRVAIKRIRMYVTSDLDDILSKFCREGVSWKHLRHPNILPLLGVTVGEHQVAMVSKWMDNGNINQFIEKDKHVNRPMLLVDISNGLKYLHDMLIVHGDLKGANILINRDKRACIADFGLATVTGIAMGEAGRNSPLSMISNYSLMSFTSGGTHRWMSPELLDPERFGVPQSEDNRPTTQSDCYAFGMVIYEVLCGHHPYIEIQSDILIISAIMEGVRPEKPKGAAQLGFTDNLWGVLTQCWAEDFSTRPSVEDIIPHLNDATLHWERTIVVPDGNIGSTPETFECGVREMHPGQAHQKGVPVQSLCEQCGRRPKFTSGNKVHSYCGRRCAELATSQVALRGFFPTQTSGPGNRRERGCISCSAALKDGKSDMCKPCHDDASSRAPAIIEVPQDHENFKSVEKQFKNSWRHNTACPEVKAVYKIVSSDTSMKQYQQYLDGVEAKGNFTAMGKARGNEHRRWHGTKRTCKLGDPGNTTFCTDMGCTLCCIVRTSFDFSQGGTSWGRFGAGIYTSLTSSKSNDYSKNVGINSDWKALLLSRVVVGYGKKLIQDDTSLTGPPPGFDSVLAEVVTGGAFNYDELVVYTNDAVRPSYLVMYQKS